MADIIGKRDPKIIAINTSALTAFGDGMTLSQYGEMTAALPQTYRDRIVSGEALAIGWLETRIPSEMQIYPGIMRIAHALMGEAFSAKVITPGKTTTDDVVWWYRERCRSLAWARGSSRRSASSVRAPPASWKATRSSRKAICCGPTSASLI